METYKNFKDTYQEVTDAVIEQLKKGNIVWRCSWNETGFPTNVTTGVSYRGWNVFWLNFHTMLKGYQTPRYITFKQAQHLGGTIRKGESGVKIVYWASIKTGTAEDVAGDPLSIDEASVRSRMVPKVYTVFNVEQTEGVEFPEVLGSNHTTIGKIEACEEVIRNMPNPPALNLQGQYPVYYPLRDEVSVPDKQNFNSCEEYYCALYHELAHSTGHQKRLGRKEIIEPNKFGSEPYSREELTAELTAAFLCGITGVGQQTLENSAAYLQGWLKALKNDKSLILKAAGQAQKAADYILNVQYEQRTT
ncbi:ArdC family protein [Mucilaginibacter litoreus]|uniref:ArdC family protein n=1 Tax=Mucilaginibacter litoreus TaxID=1048221 RepID=A0ABW3AYA6_9SPHI